MKNVHNGLGIKNMSDLILKQINGWYETKILTNETIKKWKLTEREIFRKYDNLSENELNTKSNKKVYVRNDIMTFVIKHCRGKKARREIKKRIQKKLKIPESEISECSEYDVKSKIENIFGNEKIIEEYNVKIYEIDPYFYEHCKKNKKQQQQQKKQTKKQKKNKKTAS